jgi:protein-S-isoprenylcysteine O-methyltransferase Ste14
MPAAVDAEKEDRVEGYERRLRLWTGLAWLVPAAVALHGAWRGRRASGRRVGRPIAEVPGWLLFGLLAAYVALFVRLWRPLPLRLTPRGGALASTVGAVLSLLGLALVLWGRVALGRLYNVSSAFGARLYADHELVTTGPFALVRHPMYLGALIAGVGGLLLYRTWAAVLALAHEAVFWFRAGKEEQALAAEFGGAWWDYARRVPPGIPVVGAPSR